MCSTLNATKSGKTINMESLMKTALFLHALSGGIALITGLFAIFSKKGKRLHLKSGLIYYWSMMAVVITGVILGSYRSNIFILTIAVFSFYMVFTGKRILGNKKEVVAKPLDWSASILCLSIGLFMLYLGIINVLKIGFAGSVPMLLVFGFFLSWMCLEDIMLMKSKKFIKGSYLLKHISRMGGSYIATSTAFLVVNISFQPQWIIWLLPTVIGTPMIVSASKKWKTKLKL